MSRKEEIYPGYDGPTGGEIVRVEYHEVQYMGLLRGGAVSRPQPKSRQVRSEDRAPTRAERTELARREFRENPELRLPCALWVDTSGSTVGEANEELNAGVVTYRNTLAENALAAKRVETAIVSFGGGVHIDHDFATLDRLRLPVFRAAGDTPMAGAILQGLRMLEERKRLYHENRIATHRPLIFLISDGARPTPSFGIPPFRP